ncbi:MAG: hypothetical protein E7667_05870 [Ruminococcaceae bacterium]|nr:hypothetical protein [Oscillospiraceae bacterium]
MKLKFFSVIVCLSLIGCILCASSCAESTASAEDVLSAMVHTEPSLPSGKIYLSTAAEGEKQYTPQSLLASLYGGGSAPIEQSEWVEFAIFLSSAHHPCEFAVFLCQSAQSASDTAKMLCRRLDTLKASWADTQYSSYTENGCVSVSGNYCILTVCADKKAALKAALSVIK